jgi:hypothetical protein
VKRTADDKGQIRFSFSRPFHGLVWGAADPSDESLGYSQSSANADSGRALLFVQSGQECFHRTAGMLVLRYAEFRCRQTA